MKLPKSLDVLGKEYTVVEKSQLAICKLAEENINEKVLGLCMYKEQVIFLYNAMQKDCTIETLLHETIHAIEGELGLNLKEDQVRLLSQGLYCVLKHNPEMWKLIWRKR